MAGINVQKLWGLPEAPNTLKIIVTHACGHKEKYPFEGIETAEGYRMPKAEADRLTNLSGEHCILC